MVTEKTFFLFLYNDNGEQFLSVLAPLRNEAKAILGGPLPSFGVCDWDCSSDSGLCLGTRIKHCAEPEQGLCASET